jgi:hypothetical protein
VPDDQDEARMNGVVFNVLILAENQGSAQAIQGEMKVHTCLFLIFLSLENESAHLFVSYLNTLSFI